MYSMGKKIVAEAARRLAPTGGTDEHRPDLYLADRQAVTRDTQRVMVGWGQSLEVPCVEALENWVLGNFNGTVKMEHSTLRMHPEERVATFIVGWLTPTRRVADAKGMARVAPGRYLEGSGEGKALWEVRDSEDGTPYLARTTEEDLGALLEEKKKLSNAAFDRRTFSTLKSAGMMVLDRGDEVKFHAKGLTRQGHVKRFDGDMIVIASGKDTFRIAAPAIIEMVQKDPSTVENYKSRVRSYWSKIFPPEYMSKWLKREGSATAKKKMK